MKKTLFAILVALMCITYSNAQTMQYFNKLFQNDTSSVVYVSVKPVNGGYLAAGWRGFYDNISGTCIAKIDTLGNLVWTKAIDAYDTSYSTISFGNSLVSTYDNNYAITFSKGATVQTSDWVLAKITSEGDTLWQKKYAHLGQEANAQVMATTDWGYMLAGWTAFYNANGTPNPPCMYLVKTDYKGDTLWTRQYCDDDSAVLLYAEQTQDNGYILSGYRYSNASLYDMIVIKVGEFGNEEWRKTFGTDQSDGGCMAYQLPNGNYALTGVIADVQYPRYDLFYALLKPNGDTLLTQTHHKPQSIQNFTPSFTYVEEDKIYLITISFGFTTEQVEFVVLSFNGDILYQTPINSGIGDDDYIRDIEPTPDGGFVLAGFNYQSPQSAWLVKVDSLGNTCSFMNCDSTIYTGYPIGLPIVAMDSYVKVSPNPASNQLTITVNNQITLPTTLLIRDIYNRVVKSVFIDGATTTININDLPNGIYLCEMVQKNTNKAVQKLIIIH